MRVKATGSRTPPGSQQNHADDAHVQLNSLTLLLVIRRKTSDVRRRLTDLLESTQLRRTERWRATCSTSLEVYPSKAEKMVRTCTPKVLRA